MEYLEKLMTPEQIEAALKFVQDRKTKKNKT